MPVKGSLSNNVVKRVLQAIQQEDEITNFKVICDRELTIFGVKSSAKRRLCQYQHRNFLNIAKSKPNQYFALLAAHGLYQKMPVALTHRKGNTHSDQNKNDVNFDSDDYRMGKFVFVAHFVFSFISFDQFLTFCFVLQIQTRKKRQRAQ